MITTLNLRRVQPDIAWRNRGVDGEMARRRCWTWKRSVSAVGWLAGWLGVGLVLGGCQDRGYTFATTATYDVPALGFRMEIDAVGTVSPGHDLSMDGKVKGVLSLLGEPETARVTFQTFYAPTNLGSEQVLRFVAGTNQPIDRPWGGTYSVDSLDRMLRWGGITNVMPAVLEEVKNAIEGATLGPKSTATASSAHVIVVSAKPTFRR